MAVDNAVANVVVFASVLGARTMISPRTFLLFIFSAPSLAAAADWKLTISQNLVQVNGGTMTTETYQKCALDDGTGPVQFTLHVRTQAPIDAGISHDFFLSFHVLALASFEHHISSTIRPEHHGEAFRGITCVPSEPLTGKMDLELINVLNGDGVVTVSDLVGNRQVTTKRWQDLY